MTMVLMLVVGLLPVLHSVPSSIATQYTLTLTEYRAVDADGALLAAYTAGALQLLEAFARTAPRQVVTVTGETGQVVAVDHDRWSGTIQVDEVGGERLRVTLELDRFFRGTPLLLARCEPHVVARIRARVQGRDQFTLRAIEVRGPICDRAPE